MPKFQAMEDMLHLVIPFIERDEKGQVVRDQTIIFNSGIKVGKTKVIPASISIPDSDTSALKYMRAYGGNEANGGTSFREIVEKKSEVVKTVAKLEPKVVAPEKPAEETKAETEESEGLDASDYPEATTVQAAASVLRKLFPELTSRDVNNKDKVLNVAASKNISFSNLN
jgi:hypothetical protein